MKESIRTWLGEQFGDDQELIAQVYSLYCVDAQKAAYELADCVAREESDNAAKKAHALKGLALTVGDRELADTCIQLEQDVKQGAFDRARTLSDRVCALADAEHAE